MSRVYIFIFIVLGCVCSIEAQTNRPAQWAQPIDLKGVPNLYKVSDSLYRSAQPTAEGMKNLKNMGIATIVNLRSFHTDRFKIAGTGLEYEHIYMKAWHAEYEDILRFLKIVMDQKRWPILVHCQHGSDRTGTMCAMYRIVVEGWSKEDAVAEMIRGGYGFHAVFDNLPEWIKELDVEKLKKEVFGYEAADLSGKAPAEIERLKKEYEVRLLDPLEYGRDRIEVTDSGNLRRRYRAWGDWNAEVDKWLNHARALTDERGTPPRKLKMVCVFLKNARMTSTDILGDDEKALTAVYTTPPDFVTAMRGKCMKEYYNFMFAFSGGELEVEWEDITLENLHWKATGRNWGCQPKAVGEQFTAALDRYRDAGVAMWVLCAGKPKTLNSSDPKKQFGAPPYGVSYTQWTAHGAYSIVASAPDVGLVVHEFNHRYLDNLEGIEGLQLTLFHGLSVLGYHERDCGYPHLLNTYRSVYQYIVRRDMWRRFTLENGVNRKAREVYSGRTYKWEDVANDCWFLLPELTGKNLAELTGVASFEMQAVKKSPSRLYMAGIPGDMKKILSPCIDKTDDADTALNNHIVTHKESCAVFKTETGHWLFVKPDLADVYVDMLKISGRGKDALPVYGYVNEGILPLVVLKAPTELSVPSNERGYFGGVE